MLSRGKKEEGSSKFLMQYSFKHCIDDLGIFANLDIALVIQETKRFNETPLKTDVCLPILVKLLYLIYQGEKLSTKDATNVFFSITKAFQVKDVILLLFKTN